METKILLSITVPDDTIHATVRLTVSRWDGIELQFNSLPYTGNAIVAPYEPEHSVIPYAIAAVRDVADRAVADMLERFARGEVLLMKEVHLPKI